MRFPAYTASLHDSAAETASGTKITQLVGFDQLALGVALAVNVTAASGTTPTLDLYLQTTVDNGATWLDVLHLPQITAATTAGSPVIARISPGSGAAIAGAVGDATVSANAVGVGMLLSQSARLKWVIAGTSPSLTFDATLYAV